MLGLNSRCFSSSSLLLFELLGNIGEGDFYFSCFTKQLLAKVNNYVSFIKQIEEEIVELEASRIDIPIDTYREMTTNEWWLYGKNIIK